MCANTKEGGTQHDSTTPYIITCSVLQSQNLNIFLTHNRILVYDFAKEATQLDISIQIHDRVSAEDVVDEL